MPDLRGYRQSGKPIGYENYTFRNIANDIIAILKSLNIKKVHIVGHYRGARVAYRLAVDNSKLVSSTIFMNIVPTNTVFTELYASLAFSYYYWFFLSQPFPVPEKLIERYPNQFYNSCSKDGVPTALMLFQKPNKRLAK